MTSAEARLLRPELRSLFDLAVWIEMTPEEAGERAVLPAVSAGAFGRGSAR